MFKRVFVLFFVCQLASNVQLTISIPIQIKTQLFNTFHIVIAIELITVIVQQNRLMWDFHDIKVLNQYWLLEWSLQYWLLWTMSVSYQTTSYAPWSLSPPTSSLYFFVILF